MLSFLKPLFAGNPRLDPAEAVRLVASGAAILADVREADELRTGKAKGALHLPLSTLARTSDPKSGHFERKLQAALDGGKPLILYCASGARSGRAADVLRANGFGAVHNLGSLREWVAGGGAVQR
jgi:rhodanese-related sulfurtransferase